MDVRYSPEQLALQASVAQVVEHLGPRTVAQLDDAERADKLDAAVDAAGWRELRVPDDGSAPLASGVEVAIIAEELGRGLADAAFGGPTLAAELRRLAGAPAATSPETVGFEPTLLAPAVAPDTKAPPGTVAIDAQGAAFALVLVPNGYGHALGEIVVQPATTGTDLTRPTATPDPVSAGVTMLRRQGHSLSADDLATWTALGLAITCADLVGTMRGAIDLAVEYAKARRQFGQPIGSFQAVQHLLAEAFTLMEGSRSTARHAAWAVDGLPPADALAAASVAKAYCARAARTVCETAIQVHGGIGNTWECLAHVYLRRALLSSELLGGVGPSLARVLEHHGIGASEIGADDGVR
jgi:alkylation response protein AidB-like acyl-CoA dehydrogenase